MSGQAAVSTRTGTFQNQLEAVGFDPIIAEVDRLNAGAARGVRYVAAWVTCQSPTVAEDDLPSTQFFSRTSAVRAAEIAELDFAREHYNAGAPVVHAHERVVLDDYFDSVDRREDRLSQGGYRRRRL